MTLRKSVRVILIVALSGAAVFYVFVLPAIVASGDTPPSFADLALGSFLYAQLWMLVADGAYASAAVLYGFKHHSLFEKWFARGMDLSKARQSVTPSRAVMRCLLSYGITLYG